MTVHVIQPKNSHDKVNVFRFLYEIHADEFHRSLDGMDHEHRKIMDGLDETANHFTAIDQLGRIVGCVRVNLFADTRFPENLCDALHVDKLIRTFSRYELCYASHFAVAPDARGKTVASLLIKELYHFCLNENLSACLSYCAMPFLSFYYQLGYRPYTKNFRIEAGIRVPIIHCVRDRAYLMEIKSPLAKLCPRSRNDEGAAAQKISSHFPDFIVPGFSKTDVHHLWARLAHTSPAPEATGDNFLLAGLTEEERKIINRRLSEITFAQGEMVYRRGETEPGMGVLLSGSLGIEVSVDGISRIINVIQPGEPFGEMHSLAGNHRTFTLVALEKSQAFLFPFDFLDRISSKNLELGLKLTKRLLKILAGRFVSYTNTTAHVAGSSSDSVTLRYPSLYKQQNVNEIGDRIDSYRFDSLGDQEGEFKRLIAQATIGEEIEFSVLGKLGLHDGARILDLGSGPGVTSLLMAKRLPSSSVIGVEPNDALREKAGILVASQGPAIAHRCRFLKGIGDHIPLEDDTVDFSYARLLFQHLPNPIEILNEMKRVTRREGIVVVLDVDDRSNIIHPAPEGLAELEKRIADAQTNSGGDRYVGRKLHGYMYQIGLQNVGVEHVPITADTLGRAAFFSIVYSFKRQVLERAGELDEPTHNLFHTLETLICEPSTFAMTTVFVAYGIVP